MRTVEQHTLTPLQADSLATRAAHTIRNYIVSAGLRVDDPLPPERRMASAMVIHRATLRKALRMLETEGLIRRNKGCRPVVAGTAHAGPAAQTRLLRRELQRREDIRMAAEVGAAAYACARRTPHHLKELRAILDRWEEKYRQCLPVAEEDTAFHLMLLSAAGDSFLTEYGDAVRDYIRLATEVNPKGLAVGYDRKTLDEHHDMLNALERRDRARLISLLLPPGLRVESPPLPQREADAKA